MRPLVVPKPPLKTPACAPASPAATTPTPVPTTRTTPRSTLSWAAALKRVWGVDIFECTRCGGKLTILAFIEKSSAVKEILDHLGLPSAPLPLTKARAPPQLALAW